jgi:hypothetical protein
MRPFTWPPIFAAPLLHCPLLHLYAVIPPSFYPPPNPLQHPLRRMELRQIGRLIYPPQPDLRYRLRFVKGRMISPHVPHACRLPRPEHLGHIPCTLLTPVPSPGAPSSDPRLTPNTPTYTSVLHAISTSPPASSIPAVPVPRAPAASGLQTPPLPLALAPPPVRLPIVSFFPCLLRLRSRFLRH